MKDMKDNTFNVGDLVQYIGRAFPGLATFGVPTFEQGMLGVVLEKVCYYWGEHENKYAYRVWWIAGAVASEPIPSVLEKVA